MKIVSITKKGSEYCYIASESHKVPEKAAVKICETLNRIRYGLATDKPDLCWFVYDVGPYDIAAEYAAFQSFGYRKGNLVERRAR